MTIQQISVFLENRAGRLAEITEILANAVGIGINVVNHRLNGSRSVLLVKGIKHVKANHLILRTAGSEYTEAKAEKQKNAYQFLHRQYHLSSFQYKISEYTINIITRTNAKVKRRARFSPSSK